MTLRAVPPVPSRFHGSSPPGHGRSCGATWVAGGGDGGSKTRYDGGDSRLCRHTTQRLERCERGRHLVAPGVRGDAAARRDSWRLVRSSALSRARAGVKTAPKKRLYVVEAVSMLYN